MSKVRRGALAAGVVLAAAATVAMPSPAAPAKARSSADHPYGPSPALRAMLREIDARRVQSDITALHRLAKRQRSFRPARRARAIPTAGQSRSVTNLVATLRGTQPESADRVYVVSGHYDTRCTDVLNFTCVAPGADDDASGVAAVLELARVMAKRQFDATIVFMAVAGEEQGLFGSTFFAQQAKAQGMDVEGMFTNDIVGSSTSDKGRRDPFTVRLFSEGVPTTETPAQAALRQSIGGENDGPSRQLARYVKEVGESSATGMHVRLVWRARSLPARRRSDPVPAAGLSGGTLHRAGARTSPTSTRTSGWRTASSSGTCRSSSTSPTPRAWRASTARRSPTSRGLRRRPRRPGSTRRS